MIRKGDWKLIYFHTGTLELYNVLNDIGETNNLAEKEPEKTKELAKNLSDYLRETGAGMSIDKKTNKPVPYPYELLTQRGH